MSDGDKHILNVVKQVLNEELKSIVAIFKANQPEESSRMVRLVSETIETSLKPVKEHLNNQDTAIKHIKDSHDTLEKNLEPIVKAFKDSENTRIVVDKWGTKILQGSKNVSLVGGAGAIIWIVLKFIGNLLIQK